MKTLPTRQLRTLRSAQNQCETGPAGAEREYEVEHGKLFRERVRIRSVSEAKLRCDLAFTHPEWFPVAIVEVNHE